MRRNRATSFLKEFNDFILKGNVVDLAIAVVIGGAFGKIIESLIADIITPLLLKPALQAAKVEDLSKLSLEGILYGKFLATTLNFIVIAFVMFLIIRTIAAVKRNEEAAAEPSSQDKLILSLDRVAEAIENKL